MEITVTSVPVLSRTGDRMNPDAMEFAFRKADGSAAAARITGNFGLSLPLAESDGDTAHLEYELEGYWDDQDPGLYHIHWDEPPDDLRAVGSTPERLAAGIAEKPAAPPSWPTRAPSTRTGRTRPATSCG